MRGNFANELELEQNKQHNTGILFPLNSRSSKVRLIQFLVRFQINTNTTSECTTANINWIPKRAKASNQ